MKPRILLLPLALCALSLAACGGGDSGGDSTVATGGQTASTAAKGVLALTIRSGNGSHAFSVERAMTSAEQEKGLMYRTDIPDDGGMLFWPYPPTGPARPASFWMKNTPSPLDIIFIRADGTIARIAENTVPFSEDHVDSGEPVSAVLEIKGGRSSALGIAEGDKVDWAH